MGEETAVKSAFRGWRGLILLVLGCLLLGGILLSWWYQSRTDLDDIRTQAIELGMPTTWSDVDLTLASAEQRHLHGRLGELTRQLQPYEWARMKLGPGNTPVTPWVRYAEPPPNALAYHASLDHTLLDELLSTLDRLGSSPLILRTDFPAGVEEPEISWIRQLMALLVERMRLSKNADLPIEIARLLKLMEIADIRTQNHLMIQSAILAVAVYGLATRTDELKTLDPALIKRLADITDRFVIHAQNAYQGMFISAFGGLSSRSPGEVVRFLKPDAWPWMDRCLAAPLIRLERHRFLLWTLENAAFLQREHQIDAIIAESRRLTARNDELIPWNPINSIHLRLGHESGYIHRLISVIILQSRVLIAEASGTPWPADVFAPGNPPLRRIEREGRLMGVYSVGEDGIDDGGDKKKDRYFPLYGPLEPPVSAGP